MDPILSPLIKPVNSLGSRLRSSLDPMPSTNTSLDSSSKLFFFSPFSPKTCININICSDFGLSGSRVVSSQFNWAYTVVISRFGAGCCFRDFLPCKAQE